MRKKSEKKKSTTIITSQNIVVNTGTKVCNLFKKKPEHSIKWIDEDGSELTHPDEISDFLKRVRMREKEKFLLKNEGDKLKRKVN